jgi:hypothetical protein
VFLVILLILFRIFLTLTRSLSMKNLALSFVV